MKPAILLVLCLAPCAAGCKHSSASSSTEHTETSSVTESTSSEMGAVTTTTTQTEGPGETTITVREYDPPSKEEPGSPDESEARPDGVRHQPPGEAGLPPTVPRRGPLRKETVTVAKSGGETTQSRTEATSQGTAASETHAAEKADVQAKAQEESKPSAGCIGASWIWGLAVLVGVSGVVWFAVKMRRAV